MELSKKKLTAIFTVVAGITAGTIVGVGTLMQPDGGKTAEDKINVAVKKPNTQKTPSTSAAGLTAGLFETVVIATPQNNVIHVRAHTWVAQFAMASVCVKGQVAEPKPCHYEANMTDKNGGEIRNFKKGQKVFLRDLHTATGNIAPHDITVDIPNIRPRQDIVEGPVPAKVTKLIDGDTVQVVAETFKDHFVLTDIRIGDIDTPEKKGRAKCASEAALAETASEETRKLIEGKNVLLYGVKFEKYGGRVLGDIKTESGVSAAQNLIDKNLAKPYDGGTKASWCAPKVMTP